MDEIKLEKSDEQKRHQQNIDGPQQKRQKSDESDTSNDVPANAVETKTITNIFYDCLERIFDFLDIESLLMVANTCKRLQIAAAAKFGDEYGNKDVELYPHVDSPSVHSFGAARVEVNGMKFCLSFLRGFGGKITNLTAICKDLNRPSCEYLNKYINQYCADTLVGISIYSEFSKFSNEAFEKPFKNVEEVDLNGCHFSGESMSNFANWFPKMHRLELSVQWHIDDTASMNVHIPQLKHLHLDMYQYYNGNDRTEIAMNMIESNKQLQCVDIESYMGTTLSILLDKIHGNSTITKLYVFIYKELIHVNAIELKRFVAEHPLIVELDFHGYRLEADDAINFIPQMKSLEHITFRVDSRAKCDRIIKEFEDEWESDFETFEGEFYIELNR